MDLETENRLAAMLMKEAAELRRQAEKEGVLAYLGKPNARMRPNSRFLSATVLGVQQANRAVEVNEMWRLRQKELELDESGKNRSREGGSSSSSKSHRDVYSSGTRSRHDLVDRDNNACTSHFSNAVDENCYGALEDEELEKFLHSRVKRGRGSVGARMDETGPYLPPFSEREPSSNPDAREHQIYCPEKPSSMKNNASTHENSHKERRKKSKKVHSRSERSEKKHSKRHKSKERSKHKEAKERKR